MDARTGLNAAVQIAAGLKHAHDNGVVHGRINADVVVLAPSGTAKVMETGFARVADVLGLARDVQAAAPEVLAGRAPDVMSDVYSVGAVLYAMLTGRPPFEGTTEEEMRRQALAGEATPPEEFGVALPHPVAEIVRRAMAVRPQDRFDSAGALLAKLRLVRRQL